MKHISDSKPLVKRTPEPAESTADWALFQPGFVGSIKQLTCCARCGEKLPAKPYTEPRKTSSNPVLHIICDACFDELPD